MAVPTTFADLSTTESSNSPAGSENAFPSLDNYLRIAFAMLASIKANTATNGWVSPYLPNASALVFNESGADLDARFEGDTDANLLFLDAGNDRVYLGTNSAQATFSTAARPHLAVEKAATYASIAAYAYSTTATAGGTVVLGRSRSASNGTLSATSSGDGLGVVAFEGVNTSNALAPGPYIFAKQDGAGQNTYIPGRLEFYTGNDSYAPVERLRLDSEGNTIVYVQAAAPTLDANRQMVFTLTSDTNLLISVRGADGATRTANITLT